VQVESGGDDSSESEDARQCALAFRNGGPGGEKSSPSHGKNSLLFNLNDTLPSGLGRTCR
jgi:hypothetical protein